jgi:hypothetical protein
MEERRTLTFSRTESAREPHGAVVTHSPTLIPAFADSAKLEISEILFLNRDAALTIISPLFLANSVVLTVRPESITVFIVFSLADTKTSAGDPLTI